MTSGFFIFINGLTALIRIPKKSSKPDHCDGKDDVSRSYLSV
ncbi:hypothetical protein [Rosenbergiella australiborealis]|nr:hypothetical protein [Rosenbergiella australiborealis]